MAEKANMVLSTHLSRGDGGSSSSESESGLLNLTKAWKNQRAVQVYQ